MKRHPKKPKDPKVVRLPIPIRANLSFGLKVDMFELEADEKGIFLNGKKVEKAKGTLFTFE